MSAARMMKQVPEQTAAPGRHYLHATSGFCLACSLRCAGCELAGMRRAGQRSTFVYRDQPTRQDDILASYSDRAPVPPLRFASAVRALKALLHHA